MKHETRVSSTQYTVQYSQWRSQGGNRAFAPPPLPLGLRQALGRECTHQADQGENGNLQ